MTASLIVFLARLLTGVRARWSGELPGSRQSVFFANHTSNLDFVLLWASMPPALRAKTRPVAAADYWRNGGIRQRLADDVFRAVLIERHRVTKATNPLAPMLGALADGDSLIIFPEGTRNPGGEPGEFKPGLFHIARACPSVDFVPVFIENLNRVLPKGEILPVPVLCSVHFGAPLPRIADETKAAFLARAREALLALRPL